ncbi:MAG: ATP-binding protein [Candidatus Rokubacteria bacterium]|nr:ATP-binding protein [Candidatus Rokubacteria bacterium]
MLRRGIEGPLKTALADTPVVLLTGARQAGKSTLAQTLVPEDRYLTLDDATVLAAAQIDPAAFISRYAGGMVVIDEVQRVPDLLLAIKASVDRDRRPGRFLLTGSSNIWFVPRVADSLVGRMEILTLWPLSQGEIMERREGFLEAIRRARLPGNPTVITVEEMAARIVRGGYPAVYSWSERRRAAWLRSYVTGVLERDVRELTSVEAIAALPRLVTLLATRVATLVNLADVSRTAGIAHTTLQRYMAVLERTFLIHQIPGWGTKLGARVLKSAKFVFADTGLAMALLHLATERLPQEPISGPVLENFVIMELRKQASWQEEHIRLYHFRTPKGIEVDVVVELEGNEVIGIEVTRSQTVTGEDFRGLNELARIAGRRFRAGVILYLGRKVVSFGKNLHAIPLAALWEW